jgi:hypothetical protein
MNPRCPNCGVRFLVGQSRCPLCDTSLVRVNLRRRLLWGFVGEVYVLVLVLVWTR